MIVCSGMRPGSVRLGLLEWWGVLGVLFERPLALQLLMLPGNSFMQNEKVKKGEYRITIYGKNLA